MFWNPKIEWKCLPKGIKRLGKNTDDKWWKVWKCLVTCIFYATIQHVFWHYKTWLNMAKYDLISASIEYV